MAKKKQTPKSNQAYKKVTVIFGYTLFALAVVAIIINVIIPWTALLFQPNVINKTNQALFLVSLVLGALLPPFIGYILGDKATHRKNKLTHHFNGVLIGIVAYWLAVLLGIIGADTVMPIRQAVGEPLATLFVSWPAIATLVITSIIAFYYAHNHKQKDSILQDRVYQVFLIGTVAAFVADSLWYLTKSYDAFSLMYSSIYIGLFIFLVIVSRVVIHRAQPTQRNPFTLSIIAVSVGVIMMSFAGQITSLIDPWYLVDMIVSGVAGILAWLLYLWLAIHHAPGN